MTEATTATTPPTTEIIRGRMPVCVVAMIRHGEHKDKNTKDKAVLFGTTVGKIDDIAKNRNFAYVDASYKPTEQHKADAIAWLKRHPKGEEHFKPLVDAVESMPVATAEEASAFESVRVAARGQTPVTKTGEAVTDAGGGNRRKGGKKAKDAVTGSAGVGTGAPGAAGAAPTGDELLNA